jgi:hypothetical protein
VLLISVIIFVRVFQVVKRFLEVDLDCNADHCQNLSDGD